MFNKDFCNEINKIGNLAIKKNMKDIYEITMLFKDIINKKDIKYNKEDLIMYNNINEAKKIMKKKLENEKVGEIDQSLLKILENSTESERLNTY